MEKILVSAHLFTTEYRGDHTADVVEVINVTEKTTVKELVDIITMDRLSKELSRVIP